MPKRLVDQIKSLLPGRKTPPQNSCQAPGCKNPVYREGYKLCYSHHKQWQAGALVEKDGSFKGADREAPNPPPSRQEPSRDQIKRLRAVSEQTLNPSLAGQQSDPRGGTEMAVPNTCQAAGCNETVNRRGHKLCYDHYKQWQAGALVEKDGSFSAAGRAAPNPPPVQPESSSGGGTEMLTASKLGKALDLPSSRVNLILAELGWIEKLAEGWKVTRQGEKQGGQTRTFKQQGKSTPYAIWPGRLLQSYIFLAAVNETGRDASKETAEVREGPLLSNAKKPQVVDLRTRFPAKYRAADGHYVRSRAELSIDNWLYMHAIVHAYQRKLPVEEDAYCDFYLPQNKVYIEYWGMEQDPAYAQRKKEKQALYTRYGLNLVELTDAELENLDDNIVRLLIPFGVDCA